MLQVTSLHETLEDEAGCSLDPTHVGAVIASVPKFVQVSLIWGWMWIRLSPLLWWLP